MGNKLKKAIRKATRNYTFGIYQTTLLGFQLEYDAKGRLITPNPNTQRGNVIIENVEYEFKKVNWIIEVYLEGELFYTTDTTPKYIKKKQASPQEKNLEVLTLDTELDFMRGYDTEWEPLR